MSKLEAIFYTVSHKIEFSVLQKIPGPEKYTETSVCKNAKNKTSTSKVNSKKQEWLCLYPSTEFSFKTPEVAYAPHNPMFFDATGSLRT